MLLCGVLPPARLTSWEVSAAATQNRKRQEKLAVLNFNPFLGTEMVILSSAYPGALQNQIQLPELWHEKGAMYNGMPGCCLATASIPVSWASPKPCHVGLLWLPRRYLTYSNQ